MNGKVLKIASNDLYGNIDDRVVTVYACFEHTKYMNNYVVFSVEGNNKLCYGSIHIKSNSLVIFSVRSEIKKYMLEFLDEYIEDKLENFKIIDINEINKVELVSYSEMEYDKINILEEKSISNLTSLNEEVKEKKPVFIYFFIFLLLMFAVGITVLYFKPDLFVNKYKELDCKNNLYDENIDLYYDIEKKIKFDVNDNVKKISVIKSYIFLDNNMYYQFKDNNEENIFFNNGERYKYIDEELRLKLFYEEETVIDDYDEMLVYMKREGYSCIENEYEE